MSRPRAPRTAPPLRAAAADLRNVNPRRHATVANMLDDLADGLWTLTRGDHVRPGDLITNALVRRLAGRHVGRHIIERATLIRWRAGTGVPEPFPKPVHTVNGAELWDRSKVIAWLRTNRPQPPGFGV
jgi:hypothetical protein